MRKAIMIFTALVFLFGCSGSVENPDDLISQDKMSEIIYDVHLGDAIVAQHQRVYAQHKARPEAYYKSIYEKHGISREQFEASLKYYTQNPALLDEVYDEVTKRLEIEKNQNKEESEEKLNKKE